MPFTSILEILTSNSRTFMPIERTFTSREDETFHIKKKEKKIFHFRKEDKNIAKRMTLSRQDKPVPECNTPNMISPLQQQ